jgi:hypothetical protein
MTEAIQKIETAVATVQGGGAMSLKQVTDRVNLVHQVLEKVMHKGTHYGTVPGCGDKFVLLKPGADVLAMTFRLVPQFAVTRTDLPDGHREYDITCSMFGPGGEMLGQGVGSCSTMEKKYRYRKDSKGNRIENEDIADVYNTVLKMGKKRAQVDATLTVTGAADLFTQDLIEDEDEPQRKPVEMPKAKPAQAAASAPATSDTITGTIDEVSEKSGERNGQPWTKYGVKMNGEWYGTFDSDIGASAMDGKGSQATIAYKSDGKYKTIIDAREVVKQ